ncbi:bifunctional 5,10-methylenetetrahydrofolate dehydrogenase/5,10-methenyltetrahydrofolate cyclohydrolase [Candidatus Neomarinimicrobiota bacterium]
MNSIETRQLFGKPVADAIYDRLRSRIEKLSARGIKPGLAVVLVGDDPASQVYVRSKGRRFEKMGLLSETILLPAATSESELLELVESLNNNGAFHGILVQMPLPEHINSDKILLAVDPAKDVDGFHPQNMGLLVAGNPRFIPCTPHGIIEMLHHYGLTTAGKHAVIVGRSNIVGKPMFSLLANKWERGNATVTICHTRTADMGLHTRQADILVVASGVPGLVSADMVKPGAVVVDVGINRVADDSEKGYHIVGDVASADLDGIAAAVTPVPKGVGPLTIAMLVQNTVQAAELMAGV